MLIFSWLQNTLSLVRIESLWELKCPFSRLFSKISDDDWLLSAELDWTCAKIKNVRKINHGTFSDCINWDDEFLSFSDDNEFVFVVDFSLRRESDNEFGFHTCGDFGSGLGFVAGLGIVGE